MKPTYRKRKRKEEFKHRKRAAEEGSIRKEFYSLPAQFGAPS